ncbi:hypothetical protein GXM_04316 [Nostoc sphaeroides CCNUC1]|uniref:Uncharacterized protein n=1 Tax=Nostoc sphaeroides CCNUC1 TaxID=2653204 RepID=A0A5P8W284_9NOSO|nr:hypothetical protein GXM_04316 [Nostoc sphaeroides CCNUC1]
MQTKLYIFSKKIVCYGQTHGKIAVRLPDKLFFISIKKGVGSGEWGVGSGEWGVGDEGAGGAGEE